MTAAPIVSNLACVHCRYNEFTALTPSTVERFLPWAVLLASFFVAASLTIIKSVRGWIRSHGKTEKWMEEQIQSECFPVTFYRLLLAFLPYEYGCAPVPWYLVLVPDAEISYGSSHRLQGHFLVRSMAASGLGQELHGSFRVGKGFYGKVYPIIGIICMQCWHVHVRMLSST